MWFGTEDGLNRYDGYNFTIFKHDLQDSNSISDNYITAIFEDRSGILWIGTKNGGLNQFNQKTDRFKHWINIPDDSTSLSSNHILSIFENRSNQLWIGTYLGGLNLFNRKTGKFKRWISDPKNNNSISHNSVITIYESPYSKDDMLWLGTWQGLDLFDIRRNTFKSWFNDTDNPESINNDHIWTICEDPSDQGCSLWLGTLDGLNIFDREKETFTHNFHYKNVLMDTKIILSIFTDSYHTTWIGTRKGLHYFNHSNGNIESLAFLSEDHILKNETINSIYEDLSGVVWIGTLGNGLYKASRKTKKFKQYSKIPHNVISLSNKSVWAINQTSDGSLWIGTEKGLNKMDRNTGIFKHWYYNPKKPNYLKHNFIWSICVDQNDILWIGTDGGGLNRFNPKTGQFRYWLNNPNNMNSLSSNSVSTVYLDKYGIVWLGTRNGGLNCFHPKNETFKHWLPDENKLHTLSHRNVWSIYEDRKGILWVGTYGGGINQFNKKKGAFIHWKHNPDDQYSLSNNNILSIYESKAGILWIGTMDGLNQFDQLNKKFISYKEKDGLPNNVIYGILEDDHGNLWLSTNKGISKFNPKSEQFRNYDIKDGLQSNEFNAGAYYLNSNGEMFMGGINGFNVFHPDSIKDNLYIPSLEFTDFKIFNKSVKIKQNSPLEAALSHVQEINLSYRHSVFSFEFAALDYNASEKNRYAYMMEGFDQNWIYCGNRRLATYTNLDPGEYIFKVKGSNNDGIWNEQGRSVKIIISPAFWQTFWFKLVIAVVIVTIIFIIYKYRISKILEIERMRTRIASDLHDDIGSTLTRISLHSEIINSNPDLNKIKSSSKKIGMMSREIISIMSDIVWAIDARNDNMKDLIDRISDFALNMLSARDIKLNFSHNGLDPYKKIPIDFRQNIYFIFKEAINNIVKHSNASQVTIRLLNNSTQFVMKIHDNGKGFKKRSNKRGHGLRNMGMRAKRIGANFDIDTNHGTTILITTKKYKKYLK
jgi:ligand-binding sensor domain-containing protein/two-component sensor histidine kinase